MRRCIPLLATCLVGLLLVQTMDLIACADEATLAQHAESHTDGRAGGGHPAPASGDAHDENGSHEAPAADCLCHLVFVPTAVLPDAVALRIPERARFTPDVDRPLRVAPDGPEHVPLS